MLITVSGEPGSGKTTVARLLARRLGLPHVYAGDLFRRQAEQRGLSLDQFIELSERDHSIDQALDAEMISRARAGDVVLEGRLAGFFATVERLPALKVFLTAGEETRARRVAEREQREWREVLASNRTRHRSDTRRYRDIYGFDLADTSVYDVVLSTDEEDPDALAERLVEQVRARFGDGRRP